MNGIQGFYVGGQAAGGFRFTDKGKNVSTANQRVPNTPEKSREEQQKNIGKIMKDMRDNRKDDRMEYQKQVGQDNNFVEDLKKLIGPQGSGRTPEPTPDPITAAYNPAMNPFFNQGIQPFSYMVQLLNSGYVCHRFNHTSRDRGRPTKLF